MTKYEKGGLPHMATNEVEMTKISFRLPVDEKNALEEYAKENDLTVSQVIRKACRDFIRGQENE